MAADKIKQVTDVLDMLAEDTSIPRNIRKGATDAKARLLDTKEAMDVRATSAIVILDDLANDPNIPLHGTPANTLAESTDATARVGMA